MRGWPRFKAGDIISFLGNKYMIMEITPYDYVLYHFIEGRNVKETISRVDTYYELEA